LSCCIVGDDRDNRRASCRSSSRDYTALCRRAAGSSKTGE
jgi:hypothetical protein